MPVFLVDSDVSILEYNSAAAELLGGNKQARLDHRGGDVLGCIHSKEHPNGCGYSATCPDCVVRQSVLSAAAGKPVTQVAATLELCARGKRSNVDVRVSTRQIRYEKHSFVLLVLEGLNDAQCAITSPFSTARKQ